MALGHLRVPAAAPGLPSSLTLSAQTSKRTDCAAAVARRACRSLRAGLARAPAKAPLRVRAAGRALAGEQAVSSRLRAQAPVTQGPIFAARTVPLPRRRNLVSILSCEPKEEQRKQAFSQR